MVNVTGVPLQPPVAGVTVMVDVTGAAPGLVAVNEPILPVPLAARPMDVLLLVQVYVVPAMAPVKLIGDVGDPEQSVWLPTGFTVGLGFTVMVNVTGVPVQPPATGVTVMVDVTGEVPALVAVNEPMLPVPLAARPMEVLLLVQLYVVPATAPVKLTAAVAAPAHKVWLPTGFTVGMGLMTTFCDAVDVVQPVTTSYRVYVPLMAGVTEVRVGV